MNELNFGEHFTPSGIVDRTDQAADKPFGLLSPLPENNPEQPGQPPLASQDYPVMPVYEALENPKIDLPTVNKKVDVFPAPLLDPSESESLRTRWSKIQVKFVDEPRASVEQADELVSDVVARITSILAEQHSSLENQWKQRNDVSTEELRLVLLHYRTFFNRMID
jgi:hypothetical protein